ncbi:MspA family porin [Nocardia sp. NPDC050718]|uniref:MspA family porin n=1 Tax=Nocardia sp. NPDC050718 TaxID=3155788 RepID=UPI0034068A61
MYRKRVAVGAALSVGHLLVLVPATATVPTHEKTYDAPGGLEYTVGHGDIAARPVGALNGMPTNREAFLDITGYGRVTGPGTGTIEAGYLVACAADVDVEVTLKGKLGFDAGADATLDVGLTSLDPGIELGAGPNVSGGLGVELSVAPGKIVEIPVGEQTLRPDATGYVHSRDFHLVVTNCAGPLTVRPYTSITTHSLDVTGTGAVFADPITL